MPDTSFTPSSGYPDDPEMRQNLLIRMEAILNSESWKAVDTTPLREFLRANSPLVSSTNVAAADPIVRIRS